MIWIPRLFLTLGPGLQLIDHYLQHHRRGTGEQTGVTLAGGRRHTGTMLPAATRFPLAARRLPCCSGAGQLRNSGAEEMRRQS